jgi:ferredoxin-NADP reductase
MVYGLSALLAIALMFMLTGVLAYSPLGFVITTGVIFVTGFVTEMAFARIWKLEPNHESGIISGLILACILPQTLTLERALLVALATALAVAVKFLLVWRGSHFLNPAAAGAFAVSALGLLPVTWWIANPSMFLPTLLVGLLILRKTRRFMLFGYFAVAAAIIMVLVSSLQGIAPAQALQTLALSYPLLFLGMFMLTEPTTLPAGRLDIALYAILVGVLFTSQLEFGSLDMTPHLALLIGNVFSLAVSPKRGLRLQLTQKTELAPNIYDFTFKLADGVRVPYSPGQYMEWTLPGVTFDSRGNRRTFSLASSPTESELRIGIKTYTPSSAFKRRLLAMQPGDRLQAGHIGGSFTLPADTSQKLLWIAGGIGVTPFRSMAQYLIDTQQTRDVVLVYAARQGEFVYRETFAAAETAGLKTFYFTDQLDGTALAKMVPDLVGRSIYISGPQAMVGSISRTVAAAGVGRSAIHTDLFTGY